MPQKSGRQGSRGRAAAEGALILAGCLASVTVVGLIVAVVAAWLTHPDSRQVFWTTWAIASAAYAVFGVLGAAVTMRAEGNVLHDFVDGEETDPAAEPSTAPDRERDETARPLSELAEKLGLDPADYE